jgi:hypothetical protein
MNYWSPVRSETGFVIPSKFWSSAYDLQNFRKRFFSGDDQGELSINKGTVHTFTNRTVNELRFELATAGLVTAEKMKQTSRRVWASTAGPAETDAI